MPGKAIIKQQRRVFDAFFKVDEFIVSHEQIDGAMSADQTRLVFERGDAAAVLLLNLDSKSVVLVEQFKLPAMVGRQRDDPSTSDGWIMETAAGMVEAGESPEATAIRETMEETGYQIRRPRLIAKFFSSPGGSSERMFLYFAEVRDSDKVAKGGGLDDEDVKVAPMALGDLLVRLANGGIDDPKLLVAAYWLQDYLRAAEDRRRLVDALDGRPAASAQVPPATASPAASGREALAPSTKRYAIKDRRELIVGYKTGAIDRIKDVSLWVNSENTDMMMDRFLGRSVSASIRFLGANKDENDNVFEDTIEEALRSAVGWRGHVKIGTVFVTDSGALRTTHNVRRIFHVATVEGVGAGQGVKADAAKLARCVEKLLKRVGEENNRFWRLWLRLRPYDSILIPLLGAGDGGLPVEVVAEAIIPTAIEYLRNNETWGLKEVYFLTYTAAHRDACDKVLRGFLDRRDGGLAEVETV